MNCLSCQKESDAYFGGKLPGGTRGQVEKHLESCPDCAENYRLTSLLYRVINEEKELNSNPFLVTRIMAGIEESDRQAETAVPAPLWQQFMRTALIGTSLAAAIFIGVMAGNLYKPALSGNQLPVELAYLNDAALESVNLLSLE